MELNDPGLFQSYGVDSRTHRSLQVGVPSGFFISGHIQLSCEGSISLFSTAVTTCCGAHAVAIGAHDKTNEHARGHMSA